MNAKIKKLIFLACFASLRSTMIVELTGLELLTNAFGVLLMFQGVAAAVGSPLLGKSNNIYNTFARWRSEDFRELVVQSYPLTFLG